VVTLAVGGLIALQPPANAALAKHVANYGAAVVVISLMAVRPLGVAGVASLLIAGQLCISVLADRLGWFGFAQIGLTPGRWIGIPLVAAGTLLITQP
jgi:uncharacterized membrane protein YdcZ (DUF606 family)